MSFSICCSNTISAFFPINVLISPKDIIWRVEWSGIKIRSSREMSFSNRNLLWAMCTLFHQIRQNNNLNPSLNDQHEEQKMFLHPSLELGISQKQKQTAGEVRCIRKGTPNNEGSLENCLGRESQIHREMIHWVKNKNKAAGTAGLNIQWETQQRIYKFIACLKHISRGLTGQIISAWTQHWLRNTSTALEHAREIPPFPVK